MTIQMGYPLDVLVLGGHEHSVGWATMELIQCLEESDAVRSIGSIDIRWSPGRPFDEAKAIIGQGKVNTILLDPFGKSQESASFIVSVRDQWPGVVFAFYTYAGGIVPKWMDEWLSEYPRFAHYFRVDVDEHRFDSLNDNVTSVLRRCQEWHHKRYDFDIVVSFAGKDRDFARAFSDELVKLGARVFYDEYFRHELLGKDLYVYLHEAYSKRARYCVALLSKAYLETVWAQHELRSAQERALQQNRIEYLLPLKLEPVSVPGLMRTTGFLDVGKNGASYAARIVAAKLWPTSDLALKVSGLNMIPKVRLTPWPPEP